MLLPLAAAGTGRGFLLPRQHGMVQLIPGVLCPDSSSCRSAGRLLPSQHWFASNSRQSISGQAPFCFGKQSQILPWAAAPLTWITLLLLLLPSASQRTHSSSSHQGRGSSKVTHLAAQPKGILYCPRRLHTCLATLWTFWAVWKTQERSILCHGFHTALGEEWKSSREKDLSLLHRHTAHQLCKQPADLPACCT